MIDIIKAKKTFDKHIKKYDMNNPKIMVKYKHSLRVSDLCVRLAKSLHLDEEKTSLIALIGLLHDIGRFEQNKLYNTFDDQLSIDHGGLGVNILFDEGLIRDYIKSDKYDEIIKKAIYNHNKLEVPDTYSEEEAFFSKIVRDADKIDIYYIVSNRDKTYKYDDESITEEVLDCLFRKSLIDKTLAKTDLDKMLITIGYLYDLNFTYSYEIIRTGEYVSSLFNALELTENKSIKAFNYIRQSLKDDFNI